MTTIAEDMAVADERKRELLRQFLTLSESIERFIEALEKLAARSDTKDCRYLDCYRDGRARKDLAEVMSTIEVLVK